MRSLHNFVVKKEGEGGLFWFWCQPGTAALPWYFLWASCLSNALQSRAPPLAYFVLFGLEQEKSSPDTQELALLYPLGFDVLRSWPGAPIDTMLFCGHNQSCRTSTSDRLILHPWWSVTNQGHFIILSKRRQKQGHCANHKILRTSHPTQYKWLVLLYSYSLSLTLVHSLYR